MDEFRDNSTELTQDAEQETAESVQSAEPETAGNGQDGGQGADDSAQKKRTVHTPFGPMEEIEDLPSNPSGIIGGIVTGAIAGILVFFVPESKLGGLRIYLAILAVLFIPQIMKKKMHLSPNHLVLWMLGTFLVFYLLWKFLPL